MNSHNARCCFDFFIARDATNPEPRRADMMFQPVSRI